LCGIVEYKRTLARTHCKSQSCRKTIPLSSQATAQPGPCRIIAESLDRTSFASETQLPVPYKLVLWCRFLFRTTTRIDHKFINGIVNLFDWGFQRRPCVHFWRARIVFTSMDGVTSRIFNRKFSREELKLNTGDFSHTIQPFNSGASSAEHLARHFEKSLATAGNEILHEQMKNGDANPNHFYVSQKKGLMSASTSTFSKQDAAAAAAAYSVKFDLVGPNGGGNASQQQHLNRRQHHQSPRPTNPSSMKSTRMHSMARLKKGLSSTMATGDSPYNVGVSSPMARMRDSSLRMETSTNSNGNNGTAQDLTVKYPSRTTSKQRTKSEDEIKKETRDNWKRKMKIAKAKKRRERQALDDYTVGSNTHFARNSAIIGCVLDNVERTKLFKRITSCTGGECHRAGAGTASEYEGSEYGSTSSGSESYTEDDYSDYDDDDDTFEIARAPGTRRGNNNNKHRGRSGKRGGRSRHRESSLDRSYEYSVDTTVPEEMTASFLSTGDDRTDTSDQDSPRHRSKSTERAPSISTTGFSNATDHAHYGMPSPSWQTLTNPHHESPNDSSFIQAFIRDFATKGESLLWHQETSASDPRNVFVRLKRGYRLLDGTYCAPRLIWTDHRKDLNYGFDMFDIHSLEHADRLQLSNFPYTVPECSVVLQLKNSTSFIFESGTERDAMRFVRGIRWIVGRLTYNLVVGSLDINRELLDLGLMEPPTSSTESTFFTHLDWSRAMDDLTEQLIENAVASRFEV